MQLPALLESRSKRQLEVAAVKYDSQSAEARCRHRLRRIYVAIGGPDSDQSQTIGMIINI